MSARRRSPRFDTLETRQLLSAAGAGHAAQAANGASTSAFLSYVSQTVSHGPGGRETLKTIFSGESTAEGPAQATTTEVMKNGAMTSVQILLQTAHGSVRLAFNPTNVTQNISTADGFELTATYHVLSGNRAFAHENGTTGTAAFWSVAGSGTSQLTITPATT